MNTKVSDQQYAHTSVERILVDALSWEPSEGGPSYKSTKARLLSELIAAIGAGEMVDKDSIIAVLKTEIVVLKQDNHEAERQITELRAERDALAMHLEARTILANREKSYNREESSDYNRGWCDSRVRAQKIARAVLSGSGDRLVAMLAAL